ncbi:MAG: hypothetical protein IPM04_13275 [Saprospiraceae bacterium]|nr:hypothetical protein [Candidatus Brachybacter algidus]MBK8748789.1 hypothetical protein [Candidatus Brachybacter algidus]
MHKIVATIIAIILLPFGLGACSGGSDAAPAKADKQVSLNGTWKADGFEAVIADNSIEVNIVDQDTSSLYWKGTFPAGSETVTSEADTEALSESMLGSQDATKTFTVKDNEISFKITIMGTSKVVHLKKG